MSKNAPRKKKVATLVHDDASRKNIPSAEHEPILHDKDKEPIPVLYPRNKDLDPQLVWRGKDEQDGSALVVPAPSLYIQERVHPKALIDDLQRQTEQANAGEAANGTVEDLFAGFNGLPTAAAKTEFYQHDANWSNRMILGDSLQVMASLAEQEGLRGQVQCIYIDPPYGIKFNSNFQWSTTSTSVKDGQAQHITREPEQVKAFRDTWRDGVHSYLTYLRDRMTVARDLLDESGSIFVQIGNENVHRIRSLLEEIFGESNFVSMIAFKTSVPLGASYVPSVLNYILMFAKNRDRLKFRRLFEAKSAGEGAYTSLRLPDGSIRSMSVAERKREVEVPEGSKYLFNLSMLSAGRTESCFFDAEVHGRMFSPGGDRSWKTNREGMTRLDRAGRLWPTRSTIRYVLYHEDYPVSELTDVWADTSAASDKMYVVQTNAEVVKRCVLMSTDPGDLVLDPTCGSGTTAYVAEQWGRRWITVDTSRVSLAIARARVMGARYPYYLLADSEAGVRKEAEIAQVPLSQKATTGNMRHGFVYERVPHNTLRSIANNAEIDVIWQRHQEALEPLRESLNKALKQSWEEWEVPREAGEGWSTEATRLHTEWWRQRVARQQEIDASIAAKADVEYLYDKPYEDKKIVRVAGRFTVESLMPHRALTVGADDELVNLAESKPSYEVRPDGQDFASIILETMKVSGIQQARKADKINFTSLNAEPGDLVCAEGVYIEKQTKAEKRAGIFIGPEFGTVARPDLVAAAREAADRKLDVLIACAFNFDAQTTEFDKLGKVPVLKARMNADLHMDLKDTSKGNLFVIFGEPDIKILPAEDGQIKVKIDGVDVFHPSTGEVRNDGPEGIACWFIDTDYNEEAFFVRHAYFLGAGDPYKALKTTLKAEINQEAWATLRRDTSRPFPKPKSGRIAVKVINHLGDEVMKIYKP